MNPSDQARQIGVVDSWLARVVVANYLQDPAGSTLLLDTGQLPAGYYDVDTVMQSSVALGLGVVLLEWRNAANNANIAYFGPVSAAGFVVNVPWHNIKIASNERIRIYIYTAITGLISASVLAVRRA